MTTHGAPLPTPTPERVATAGRLRELHRQRADGGGAICGWCLKPWPCPDERWAALLLRLHAERRRQR